MTRIGEWRTTTRRELVLTDTLCDICGRPVMHDNDKSWGGNDVTIEARIGEVYPESDLRELTECDVCATCFVTKVVPALESVGVKWRKRDVECYDYSRSFDRVIGEE